MDGRLKGKKTSTFFKSYGFTLLLILSILIGSGLGILLKKDAALLKPLGDIFLNLLFTALFPSYFSPLPQLWRECPTGGGWVKFCPPCWQSLS